MNKRDLTRRQFLKAGMVGGAALCLPWKFNLSKAIADAQLPWLSDPAIQPKFVLDAPNAGSHLRGSLFGPNLLQSFVGL